MTEIEFYDRRNELDVQAETLCVEITKHEAIIAELRVQVRQLSLDSVKLRAEYDKARNGTPGQGNFVYATVEDTIHAE